MASSEQKVGQIVRDFVDRVKPEAAGFSDDTSLYGDGVGLDSLETAELSAVLEDELGTDPFTAEQMPQTLADIIAFYDAAAKA